MQYRIYSIIKHTKIYITTVNESSIIDSVTPDELERLKRGEAIKRPLKGGSKLVIRALTEGWSEGVVYV
jgi:hypothetical protein